MRPYREVYLSAADGLRLHLRDYPGEAAGSSLLPLVCLPGLTRNARDFHPLACRLAVGGAVRRVIAIDYRGRGLSARDRNPQNYNLAVETDDVLTALAALGIHRAVFLGTSRGALIIHMLAAVRPGVIAGTIFNDAGPVVDGAGLAQIRSYLTRMPLPRSFDDAPRILKEAHGSAFPGLQDEDWRDMAEAIYIEKGRRIVGDYDPAIVKQLAGIDLNTRLPTLWPQFEGLRHVPLMVIRGAHSPLLSAETLGEMQRRRPGMQVEVVEGQGHAPLLHTAGLPERIEAFLGRHKL